MALKSQPIQAPRKSILSYFTPYLLIAPTLILVLMFTVLPAVRTVLDSLYQPPVGLAARDKPPEFVGLQNYGDLFDATHYMGTRFTETLSNTVLFSLATVLIGVPLGLGLAMLLNRKIRGMSIWRFSIFYPSLLPLIGAASIWAFIYSDSIGLANAILRSFGHSGFDWLGNPDLVLWSVIVVNIWKQAGYFMIFYLAGLQNIPNDVYEAAELAGANIWQQFRYLTLPLLRGTTLFVLIIAFTFSFQTVEQLQALGEGGPSDRSNLLLYLIFQNVGESRNWGYVNAMTVVLVGIVLVFTVSNFVFFERGRNE